MIKIVSIYFRPGDENSLPVIMELLKIFKERNIQVRLPARERAMINCDKSLFCPEKEYIQTDLVIVVGGDGTFLAAARLFTGLMPPIFGINRGKLGFLTEFSPEEYKKFLPLLLDGKMPVSERAMLEAVHSRDGRELSRISFLNDAVLSKGDFSRVINIEVEIDGIMVNSYNGDGLIVSTPTGSTAYSLSAGGPVIVPSTENVFLINPVCPHTLGMRPIIVSSESVVRARIVSRLENLLLTIDGQEGIRINCGDEITVRMAGHKVRLISHPEKNFYSILREKLKWG